MKNRKTIGTAPGGQDNVTEVVRDYKTIREDYAFNGNPFALSEPERSTRLKWIIQNKLSQVDQTLLLMYVDCLSLRKLGRRLGISHTLLAKEINRIKAHVLEEYAKIKSNDDLY